MLQAAKCGIARTVPSHALRFFLQGPFSLLRNVFKIYYYEQLNCKKKKKSSRKEKKSASQKQNVYITKCIMEKVENYLFPAKKVTAFKKRKEKETKPDRVRR